MLCGVEEEECLCAWLRGIVEGPFLDSPALCIFSDLCFSDFYCDALACMYGRLQAFLPLSLSFFIHRQSSPAFLWNQGGDSP